MARDHNTHVYYTAMHEAGHVVTAVLLGAEGVSTSLNLEAICAQKGDLGNFHMDHLLATATDHARVNLGGFVGTALAGDPLGFKGSQSDMQQALEHLGDHPDAPQVALDLLTRMLEEALASSGFQAMVQAVATALAEQGALSDQQIREAMFAMRPKPAEGVSSDLRKPSR